jgi:transposase
VIAVSNYFLEERDMGTLSYEGKQVYMGLDVHRKFFVASCICDGVVVKRCRMPGTAEAVISLVSKEFGGASVRAAYEAGYSGFWLYRKLMAAGIDCIVVHAASIELSARDTVKTDKRDSLKIAQQLAAGRLRGVRVPTEEEEQRRLLTRTRDQLMNKKRRVMVQIRMSLHYFGLFPASIQQRIKLQDVEDILVGLEGELQRTIGMLRDEWIELAKRIKEIDRLLVEQAKDDPLDAVYRSVPGVGPHRAFSQGPRGNFTRIFKELYYPVFFTKLAKLAVKNVQKQAILGLLLRPTYLTPVFASPIPQR